MSDLYDRLEELQGMTRVFGGDVERLKSLLGERSVQAAVSEEQEGWRRFYIRAVFALVEAAVEQHKRLLLDLSARGIVTLAPGVSEILSEKQFFAKDNGDVGQREQFLALERKLRAVYRAAAASFQRELVVNFGDGGWRSFCAAQDIRDRITHPKTFEECQVEGDDLDTVDRGHEWFRALNNEFVRVAREHRNHHGW